LKDVNRDLVCVQHWKNDIHIVPTGFNGETKGSIESAVIDENINFRALKQEEEVKRLRS